MQLTSPHVTSTSTPPSSHLLCSEAVIFAAMWYNPHVYRNRGESCENQGEGRRDHTFQAEHLQNPAIYQNMFTIISELDYSHIALLELLLKHPCVTCQCWKLSVLFLLLSLPIWIYQKYKVGYLLQGFPLARITGPVSRSQNNGPWDGRTHLNVKLNFYRECLRD